MNTSKDDYWIQSLAKFGHLSDHCFTAARLSQTRWFVGDLTPCQWEASQPALCSRARHFPSPLYSLCLETVKGSCMVGSFSYSQRSVFCPELES